MASRKYYWWHYIPFLLLLPILLVFYLDAWWGYQFLRLTSIVVFALIAWTIFIVIRSIAIGGLHKKLIISLSALYVLAVIFLVAVRIPAWECNPEKLVKHYEQKKEVLDELIAYTQSALDEGESALVDVYGAATEDVGLDEEEVETIRDLLRKSRCRSIDTSFPDYCDIGHKTIGYGFGYGYRIYLAPMTDEQYQEAVDSAGFFPYNDRVVLTFDGGAVGPDELPEERKEAFLQKHPYPRAKQ